MMSELTVTRDFYFAKEFLTSEEKPDQALLAQLDCILLDFTFCESNVINIYKKHSIEI